MESTNTGNMHHFVALFGQMSVMSLRLLRCMPVLCVACLLCCVMTSFTVASDFDKRVQDYYAGMQEYIYGRIDWYKDKQALDDTERSLFEGIESFFMGDSTCAFGGRSGHYSNNIKGFVYVNGVGVPQDAITFAGVFDVFDELEMAVFRGMWHSLYHLCYHIRCTLYMCN